MELKLPGEKIRRPEPKHNMFQPSKCPSSITSSIPGQAKCNQPMAPLFCYPLQTSLRQILAANFQDYQSSVKLRYLHIGKALSQSHSQGIPEFIMIAPVWKIKVWYPLLLQRLVRILLLLPQYNYHRGTLSAVFNHFQQCCIYYLLTYSINNHPLHLKNYFIA